MLLAIDTCGSLGGVALGFGKDREEPTSQNRDVERPLLFRELAGRTFSEQLLTTISDLVREAGVSLPQLTGIVVVHGPGSFTGIRIGVSAAKGLAEALAVPAIAVSRLDLLARQAADGGAVAVLDAGRGEFYVGVYRRPEGQGSVCQIEALLNRDELIGLVAEAGLPVLVCEERVFTALADLGPERVPAPSAVEALMVGAERFRVSAWDDVATLDGNYLRRSDLEMLARIAAHADLRAAAKLAGNSASL